MIYSYLIPVIGKDSLLALANSEIMIHQPAIHGNGIQGQASDIRIVSDHIQKIKSHPDTENSIKSRLAAAHFKFRFDEQEV